ncbi:Uncharacterised protein [Mycobacterium tuberculosis]|nr:Uncharacterised protein [Mycobacterium tuberculosis]CPA68195.1 Uncharacterised protein [Mycobacterium tuberculosis]
MSGSGDGDGVARLGRHLPRLFVPGRLSDEVDQFFHPADQRRL